MLDSVRLYWRYVMLSLRSQMQYRASFVMLSFGHFVITGLEFLGILVLFERFGSLRGWTLPEVALFYGIVSLAFALAEAFARGFDTFPGMVKSGDFDRLLVRPRTTVLQLAARELQLMRIGRFLQGLIVLAYATMALDVVWTPGRIVLLLAAMVGGACLFAGLFVLQATLAFWTIDGLEVMNTVTYGGVETAQFPITIYRPWFRRIFTVIVPLACINYFPAMAILGRDDPLGTSVVFHWLSPLVGVVFLLATFQVWRFGVRHYRSTGS